MQETWIRFLGWKDPLEKGKGTQSSHLPWRLLRYIVLDHFPPSNCLFLHLILYLYLFNSLFSGVHLTRIPRTGFLSPGKHSVEESPPLKLLNNLIKWEQFNLNDSLILHMKTLCSYHVLDDMLDFACETLKKEIQVCWERQICSYCQHPLDHQKSKRVPEKYLFRLYWLCQSRWLCGSQ